jgi:hypothetical protein
VNSHGCSDRAIVGLELAPCLSPAVHEGEAVRERVVERFRSALDVLILGGPVSKPVVRTNSFSKAATAFGALFSPVSTECTASM